MLFALCSDGVHGRGYFIPKSSPGLLVTSFQTTLCCLEAQFEIYYVAISDNKFKKVESKFVFLILS